MEKIVTRQSLATMLATSSEDRQKQIVGRALVVLYRRQTEAEKVAGVTRDANNIGFCGSDADLGTRCAQTFQRTGTLLNWQLAQWLRAVGKAQVPKICKYHRQLNEAAIEKRGVAN